MKRLALLALIAVSAAGCASAMGAPARPSAPAVQRAVRELRQARFGPYTGDAMRPLLRNVRCTAVSTSRIRCHATWHGHGTRPVVFGVTPGGALYVVQAGPLAIS